MGVTPDKKRVVAADMDSNVKVYDIEGKKVVKEFRAYQAALNGVMMGPDGSRFATISDNGEVKLWKTDTGEELRSGRSRPRCGTWRSAPWEEVDHGERGHDAVRVELAVKAFGFGEPSGVSRRVMT